MRVAVARVWANDFEPTPGAQYATSDHRRRCHSLRPRYVSSRLSTLRMERIVSARPFSHECFNVELNIRIQLELAIAARRECCTNSEDERAQRSHHSDARPTMGGGSRIASVRFLL